ncbi:hypothetical protein NC796_00395 [Aliifodinibius sp. S!AR15-10]|uniref:hypothetical protein n=1 Tax=Aliifodinibius sp. S!AR15-10 TaxID=2950437 RepID=UPI0028672447|nr:hypothetical protein [Aliifodinibius sp. S!AR15-10]MDR8389572.1 hypothetical protein [Aliifodinibius sp. S!AR15-10]
MNWFDLHDLENRLIESNVSDQEGFYYLLANVILFGIGSYGTGDSYNYNIFMYADMAIALCITIVGLNLTFKVNKKGDNQDYFKRFMALYFVIGIRLVLFLVLCITPAIILGYFMLGGASSNKTVQDFVFLSLYTAVLIFFYYLLIQSFQRVAQHNPGVE